MVAGGDLKIPNGEEPTQTKPGTRQSFSHFYQPSTLLEQRASINAQQLQITRHNIRSIKSPASTSGYSLGLQLRETQGERCLANHKKYLRVWDRLEERIEGHFKVQDDIKHGRTTDFQKV